MRIIDHTSDDGPDYQDHSRSLVWIEQTNERLIALERVYPAGFEVPVHSHSRTQLWFARKGIVLVNTDGRRWMIPPGHALVIPSNYRHSAEMISEVHMQSIYWDLPEGSPAHPRVVEVTPLAQNLIGELVNVEKRPERYHRLSLVTDLLLDEFEQFPERPLGLPFPNHAGLAKLCRRFLSAPTAATSIDDWARELKTSRRTFTRRFREETGISFTQWRQQACVFASLPRLAEGQSVTTVALDAGYENIAAFSTMFRRILGRPPRTYLS